jgi:hypothetical protein
VLPFLFLTGVAGSLVACAQSSAEGGADAIRQEASTEPLRAVQIIVKFRDPHVDLSQSGFLDEISRDVGAALVHVRPMSGGAHVLRPAAPVDYAELDRIIGRLGKRQDVEYAEPDRPMRHMMDRKQ